MPAPQEELGSISPSFPDLCDSLLIIAALSWDLGNTLGVCRDECVLQALRQQQEPGEVFRAFQRKASASAAKRAS